MSKARDLADILKASGKLANIEAGAEPDQTNAEIKTSYEANADTNAFTDTEKTKVGSVASSANNYTHPTGAGDKHIPTAGASGQFLKYDSSGTAVWAADNNTVYVHPNHSGDVVSSADGATTIQTDAVDIAMLSATGTASATTFLRGDNSWQVVSSPLLDSPSITGTLSVDNGGNVSHTIANWSDDITYVITPTNCTVGAVNTSGVFVVTHTSGSPSYTIKSTTDSLGLDDSALVTKNLLMNLTAPTLSSPADVGTATNVVYTITSTDTGDDKIILDIGSSNFTFQSVSIGSASKVGNTVVCTGFTTNNPAVTIQFTAEATYSVTAKSVNIAGTYGDSASSSADSIVVNDWSASGGTETTVGSYTVHTFTSSGTFTAGGSGNVDVLVVAAGGGSGGSWGSAGGGAGGFKYYSQRSLATGTYNITIGAGGPGGAASSTGTVGDNSSFASLVALGGGYGGAGQGGGPGGAGGSGGGGGSRSSQAGGAGTANQGFAGGASTSAGAHTDDSGGGGGGASEVGASGGSGRTTPGDGGDGYREGTSTVYDWEADDASTVTFNINGTTNYYAGGGGGAAESGSTAVGGQGGGGNSHAAGTVNTGGGGGGRGNTISGTGFNGGSGIVIIRYLT